MLLVANQQLYLASVAFLRVSYAQELADKLARDCRRIMMSDWYRRVFPTRLSPGSPGGKRIRDDGAGLPARNFGRSGADRAWCRPDHHRRPAEARGGVVASPATRGERVVRPYPLQPAQRQATRWDRAGHAPP